MRSLWAVARETFTECVRTKSAAVFVLLLVVSLPAMALTIEGDGTLKGRIQTFLAYSSSWTQLLLSLATILLAVGIVTEDVRAKTIFTVAAKPLARWQYLLGRWLGVVMLDAALVALAGGAIYGLSQHLRRLGLGQIPSGVADSDITDVDRLAVENEVFSARVARNPQPFDVTSAAEQRYQQLVEERGADALIRERIRGDLARARGAAPDEADVEERMRDGELRERVVAKLKSDLRKQLTEARQLLPPGYGLELNFRGLSRPSEAGRTVQLRYRLRRMGKGSAYRDAKLYTKWRLSHPEKAFAPLYRSDPDGQMTSIMVPSEAITDKGTLTLAYMNEPATMATVQLKLADVTLLYPVATFEGNFFRANLLILTRLAFLAAAGVLFGAFLSFKIAALSCLIVLLIGIMSSFILEATAILPAASEPTALDYYSHYMVRTVFLILPRLPLVSSPADALVEGKNIPWATVAVEAGAETALRALLALGIGWLIFRRRELARVQV